MPEAQTILDGLHEPLFLLDSERTISFMNKAAIDIFGADYLGQNFVRLIRHPEIIGLISKVSNDGGSEMATVPLRQPVENVFEFKVTKIPSTKEGEPIIAIALKDLTDLKNAEQMRSDFVANVSHELRSPLTALSGFVETIKGPARDDADARDRFLTLMEREAARMVRLISDLLSLSKVETNSRQREFTNIDMAKLTQRAVTTISETAKLEGKSINLTIEPGLGSVTGIADELTQVLINLIENGLKYGKPDSSVKVSLQKTSNVGRFSQDSLTIIVEDEGEGFAREHIPRLTERFYRVDAHRSRDKGGTGLGLAIVKHIVNQHRGHLQISSVEGKGSTFKVHLPFSQS